MKLNVYSVYDCKARVFGNPFYLMNDDVAMRSVARGVNDSNTQFFHSPQDFQLRMIGSFDDANGVITPCDHVTVCELAALKPLNRSVEVPS